MAGITLAQAEARLASWLEADAAVAKGQSYSVGGRSVSRTDAAVIRENITFWEGKVTQLQSGGSGGRRVRSGVLIP
jgi:hypothetical protein